MNVLTILFLFNYNNLLLLTVFIVSLYSIMISLEFKVKRYDEHRSSLIKAVKLPHLFRCHELSVESAMCA